MLLHTLLNKLLEKSTKKSLVPAQEWDSSFAFYNRKIQSTDIQAVSKHTPQYRVTCSQCSFTLTKPD